MEMEPGEGKAHESAESPDEEVREGSEPDDSPHPRFKTNRKRRTKGSENTKAPMDSEGGCCNTKKGKAPCSACASGKPCTGKTMKDAGCSKRGDALTPQEYLAACDLGIQGQPRSYIRSRLDMAQRLDLKCGNGAISQGEKCHKGSATKTSETSKRSQRRRSNLVKAVALGAGAAGAAIRVNNAARNIASNRRINTRTLKGIKNLKAKGNDSFGAAVKTAKHMNENYPGTLTQQQSYYNIMNAKVTRGVAREGAREGLAELKKMVPMSPARRRAARRKRRDSIWAEGFEP
jgi:hypothetical protein